MTISCKWQVKKRNPNRESIDCIGRWK
jgi:hypothetical protein